MPSTNPAVSRLIRQLDLKPHPEGGHYRETYRCAEQVARPGSGSRRSACTAIYYLLSGTAYSAWHRIDSDELWHFHLGCPLTVYCLSEGEGLVVHRLGNALEEDGAVFQAVVPAGSWFAAERMDARGYSLVGCTVAPGFEFSAFELARADDLRRQYPAHDALIRRLCAPER